MTEQRKIFISAIMSGVFVSVAGTAYLSVANQMLGSFLFGLALMAILSFNFRLYTGSIGYLAIKNKLEFLPYLLVLVTIWSGNLLGCLICGNLLRFTRFAEPIQNRADELAAIKLGDEALSVLILSFFCGLLMYTAVEIFGRKQLDAQIRVIVVFLCVMVFIWCGFEHCIANMFYFSAANVWSWHTVFWLLLMTLGNALGGMTIPIADRLRH